MAIGDIIGNLHLMMGMVNVPNATFTILSQGPTNFASVSGSTLVQSISIVPDGSYSIVIQGSAPGVNVVKSFTLNENGHIVPPPPPPPPPPLTSTVSITPGILNSGQTGLVLISWNDVVQNFNLEAISATEGTVSGLTAINPTTYSAVFTPFASIFATGSVQVLQSTGTGPGGYFNAAGSQTAASNIATVVVNTARPAYPWYFGLGLSGPENTYPVFPTRNYLQAQKNLGITHFRLQIGWSLPNAQFGTVGVQPVANGPLDITSTYLPVETTSQVNLLNQSNAMGTSPWHSGDGGTIANVTSFLGSTFTDAAANQVFTWTQSLGSASPPGSYWSIEAKAGSQGWIVIQGNIYDNITGSLQASAAYFNLLSGVAGSIQQLAGTTPVFTSSGITPVTGQTGVYRCWAVQNAALIPAGNGVSVWIGPASGDLGRQYTGTGQIALFLGRVQINAGPTLLPYSDTAGGYVQALDNVFNDADALGLNIILDLHAFGFGPGGFAVGTPQLPVSALVNVWTQLLQRYYQRTSLFAVDFMNEPVNGFDSSIVMDWSQQLITVARNIGFTGQIHIEGVNYAGIWNWVSGQGQPFNNANLYQLTDPLNNLAFQGHVYPDHDSSGSHYAYQVESVTAGVAPPGLNTSATIGNQRLNLEFLPWLQQHNLRGVIGEYGASTDSPGVGGNFDYQDWIASAVNFIDELRANNIPFILYGGGLGFTKAYPYSNANYLASNYNVSDLSAAGVQNPLVAGIINRYVTNPSAQPTTYALIGPYTTTSTGDPNNPIITPDVYETVGQPSNPFRVIYGGQWPSAVTITPAAYLPDGVTSAGGTFAPASITFAAGAVNPQATFTYTPAVTNTILIKVTNNAGWTDPPFYGVTTETDAWRTTGLIPNPLFNLYRSQASYTGPVLTLAHPITGVARTWSFTNGDNFDRVAIQNWAGIQSGIPILYEYDISGNGNGITYSLTSQYTTGVYPTLTLQNSAGYPEIVCNQPIGDFNAPISRDTSLTVIARINQGNSPGQGLFRMDKYTGPLSFGSGAVTVTNTNWIGGTTVTGTAQGVAFALSGIVTGAYHEYAFTYSQGPSGSLKTYIDAALNATSALTSTRTSLFTITQSGTIATLSGVTGTINVGDTITAGNGVAANTTFVSQINATQWTTSQPGTANAVTTTASGPYYPLYTAFDSANIQFGYFIFGGGNWNGKKQSLAFVPNAEATSSQLSTIQGFETTHYSTPLPDTLPPIIGGVASVNANIGANTPIFSVATVQDVAGTSVSIQFTLTGQTATLSGTGLTGSNPYTLTSDTAANIQTKMRALQYTSSGSAGAVTHIAMLATSSTALTYSTSVDITLQTATNPVISGMVAPTVSMDQGAPPLWLITVTDPNPGATVSASISVSGGGGTMTNLGPTAPSGTGPYTFAADTPANLTRWLRNLLWTPAVTTVGTVYTFTVTITDSLGKTASASNTITNVAPQAYPTALTPVATPAALPNYYWGLNMSGGEDLPPAWSNFQSRFNWAANHAFKTIRLPFVDTNVLSQDGSGNYLLYHNFGTSNLQAGVECARTAGQWCILDHHEYGYMQNPFYTGTPDDTTLGVAIGSDPRTPLSALVDFQTRLVKYFSPYPNIMLGIMNEPGWSGAFSRTVMSAVSTSVRTISTTIPIIAPSPSNASFFDTSGVWNGYTDPAGGPFFMDVHQYFDNAGGNGSSCVSTPPGGYFDTYVNYCRSQGFKTFITEYGWQTATNCNSGLGASIAKYFNDNADVIVGPIWWSYGSFPTSYSTYMGPTNGGPGEGDPRGSPTDPVQYAALSPYLPSTNPAAPTITGFNAFTFTSSTTPFSGVTIGDTNSGATDSITIHLTGATATLSGSGISGSNPYTIAAASAASVTSTLQGLILNTSATSGTVRVAITVYSSTLTNYSQSVKGTIGSATALRHNVATTAYPNAIHANTTTKAMSVQPYLAFNTMNTVQIVLLNCGGANEAPAPGTTTFTAAIQDASNNFTQITFSGSASGACTSKYLVSDEVTLVAPITAGSQFNVRVFQSNPAGQMWLMGNGFPPGGSGYDYSSTASDSTMSNTSVAITYEGNFFCPSVIATRHTNRAIAAYGDSICYGVGTASNVVPFFAPRTGLFASIGGQLDTTSGHLPFANFGLPSDLVFSFVTGSNGTARAFLSQYFTHACTNYGVNDFNLGRTATQVQADITTMAGLLACPLILGTPSPSGATSTNDFADNNPANQTAAGYNPQRVAYCTWIRTQAHYIDSAAALEIAVNDGKWQAGFTDSSDPWDGIHPTQSGYAAAQAVVNLSVFT